MDDRYDVIVVGCGGLGSAALYWLSREVGPSVLGIEQFGLGHAYKVAGPIGRILKQLALDGGSSFPIEKFRLGRPAISDASFEKTFHA